MTCIWPSDKITLAGSEVGGRDRDSYLLPESLFLRDFSNYPIIHTSGNTLQENVNLAAPIVIFLT